MPVYVQHEVLGKVPDVFNAEALWQAPGLALFSRKLLLRDLLERAPREHRGRAATRCFSHVTLMLPQDEVDDDRHLTRGERVRALAQSLATLHQKDFGDLLGADEVRYDVIGATALEAGQVEVKFGHAVYLPAPGEHILYTVTTSRDSAVWQPVCLIYPNQRLALIGHDEHCASHAVPGWPFGADDAILLINDGPDTPLEVQARPKGGFDCSFDPITGYYTIKSKRAGAGDRLLMKISRVAPHLKVQSDQLAQSNQPVQNDQLAPSDQPAPLRLPAAGVWKNRPRTFDEAGQTAVPLGYRPPALPFEADATYAPTAPLAQQRVTLAALALPRLSRYRDTGALALEIGLDCALALAASANQAVISFAVDANDTLHVITSAGRERISAPASFTPVDARCVNLLAVAPAMAERYCAMICLPQPIGVAVASGARFVFGRSAPMLAALRVLDSARFLQLADGCPGASADRIGLSRNAFNFEAAHGAFQIGRLSATQALFHLDERMQFVACIGDAPADQPYTLPPGHHLVAGHYVLRFNA